MADKSCCGEQCESNKFNLNSSDVAIELSRALKRESEDVHMLQSLYDGLDDRLNGLEEEVERLAKYTSIGLGSYIFIILFFASLVGIFVYLGTNLMVLSDRVFVLESVEKLEVPKMMDGE